MFQYITSKPMRREIFLNTSEEMMLEEFVKDIENGIKEGDYVLIKANYMRFEYHYAKIMLSSCKQRFEYEINTYNKPLMSNLYYNVYSMVD